MTAAGLNALRVAQDTRAQCFETGPPTAPGRSPPTRPPEAQPPTAHAPTAHPSTADPSTAPHEGALYDARCGGGPLLLAQPGISRDRRLRAALEAVGFEVTGLSGLPTALFRRALGARVPRLAVWGRRAWSIPGRLLARAARWPLLTLEDGPLRAIQPPGQGAPRPPASLTIDDLGIAIDAGAPSRLERQIAALATAPPDPALAARAERGIALLRERGLSKYTPQARGQIALPEPGYVLVIDQTAGDASIRLGAAGPTSFSEMLATARAENPGARIVVKGHPQTGGRRGKRGHLTEEDLAPGEVLLTAPANPWDVVERASRVYAVSSQLGYEALLAGRPVTLFGLPFYAGWGLTDDRVSHPRMATARGARPALWQLFAATHLFGPLYVDPETGQPTGFEGAVEGLTVALRVEGGDATGGVPIRRAIFAGFSAWKRHRSCALGPSYPDGVQFCQRAEQALAIAAGKSAEAGGEAAQPPRRVWAWASRAPAGFLEDAARAGVPAGLVEDGFLRSVGLGATLTDAASLVFDTRGIHYDPTRPSTLEELIATAAGFAADDPRLVRAARLAALIREHGVTKYNLRTATGAQAAASPRPMGPDNTRPTLLVAGQVADDASVRLGTAGAEVQSNGALLAAARRAAPDAYLIYKPHPDVEAGLRLGALSRGEAAIADEIATRSDANSLLARADHVWTMTSLIGFEALLRGIPVTCAGVPFYAGWGLTTDLGPVPSRRRARPSLEALVWAALIAYPRYVDPEIGRATTPERLVARLATGRSAPRGSLGRQALSAAQSALGALGLVRWR